MSDTTILKKLTVSASPHKKTADTTRGIMLDVIIAMLPALVLSVVLFGPRALIVTLVSVVACVVFEFLARKAMKRNNTIGDLSAVVTGMLLAFNLPSTMPLWMVVIGDAVAIIVVKQFFGGIGQNSATPLAKFPSVYGAENIQAAMDAAGLPSLTDMFFGVRGGCLGETCAAALLVGLLYLLVRRVISPTIPLTYVLTVGVIMLIEGQGNLNFVAYQLLSGGLLLGAIFMATDYTTSPISFKGKIIYAVGCGVITALIRIFGSLPEGVSFSIILMNILVPHIEHMTTPKPFGTLKEKKKKKEAAE